MEPAVARRMWELYEPYHAVVYFSPEAKPTYEVAGLKGGWMGYFASRSAALGAVPPDVVAALFYNFHPSMVGRALPDAWRFSSPDKVLAARLEVADRGLRTALGDDVDSAEVQGALEIARAASEKCTPEGRPLFAAHSALEWPAEPHLALWHAATLLREHRGDGHVACLLAAGLDGCEANVTIAAVSGVDPSMQRTLRGWSDEEWNGAVDRLRRSGLLDTSGALTPAGAALRKEIEQRTDELAMYPWAEVGVDAIGRFEELMRPLAGRVMGSINIPFPNPMGLTKRA